MVKQLVFGAILATIGTLLIIFREGFVKDVVRLNNKDSLGFSDSRITQVKNQRKFLTLVATTLGATGLGILIHKGSPDTAVVLWAAPMVNVALALFIFTDMREKFGKTSKRKNIQ